MCRPYGWVLGSKFSKQWSLFRQIFHKHAWVIRKLAKNSQKWIVFRQNSSQKWVRRQVSVIRRGYVSEKWAADPRPSASHILPPGDRGDTKTTHKKNLEKLMAEVDKSMNHLNPEYMWDFLSRKMFPTTY